MKTKKKRSELFPKDYSIADKMTTKPYTSWLVKEGKQQRMDIDKT